MGMLKHAKAKKDEKRKKASSPQSQEDGSNGQAAAQEVADDTNSQPESGGAPDETSDAADTSDQQQQPDEGEDASPDSEASEGEETDGGVQGGSPDSEDESQDATQDQVTGQPGSPADDTGAAGASGTDLQQMPISPALQEEYQRANAALYTALYTNDNVAQAILKHVQTDPQFAVKSIASAAMLLFTQIDKQLRITQSAPQIVLPFVKDIVAHVLDLAQQVKGVQWTEQQANSALGTALEMVLRIRGVSKKNVQSIQQHIPRSQLQQQLQNYRQALANSKGAANPQPQPGAPAQGQPTAQGGQPPGGMLSQAQGSGQEQEPDQDEGQGAEGPEPQSDQGDEGSGGQQ